jgi:hypothetical protein
MKLIYFGLWLVFLISCLFVFAIFGFGGLFLWLLIIGGAFAIFGQ